MTRAERCSSASVSFSNSSFPCIVVKGRHTSRSRSGAQVVATDLWPWSRSSGRFLKRKGFLPSSHTGTSIVSDPLRSEPFPPLYFLFGIHNHQPVGNFDEVIRDALDRAYFPFLQLMREFPDIRFTVHTSGTLLSLLESSRPAYLDLPGELVDRGQVELLGGGLYEPILSM